MVKSMVPVLDTVSPDDGGASDTLPKVGIDGRPGYGLQPLQLSWGRHIEPLYEVVDYTNRNNHRYKDRRWDTNHD